MSMFFIVAPDGREIAIPTAVDPAADPYPPVGDAAAVRAYYEAHGYVVVRDLLPAHRCDEARRAFVAEVKRYGGFLYRQATADPERHVFTPSGFMLNSLLNVHDLDGRCFPRFREAAIELLTHPRLQRVVEALVGEAGVLVQSMYFEGNPATWAHQDTYYLDATEIGRMAAAWIAVEDIHPGAGRFYVYPGSHRLELLRNRAGLDIAFHHREYQRTVIDLIRSHGLECRAPALGAGDVLFWSSRTIHGSLETREPTKSRSSFTAHFVPRSTGLLQYQARVKRLRLRERNGLWVHHPKDQERLVARAVLEVVARMPRAHGLAKRLAVKLLTR
jgi:phytanoyl-CoA hydroxylase